MKNIYIKPFGLQKLSENIIDEIQNKHTEVNINLTKKELNIKGTKQIVNRGNRSLIGISPHTKTKFFMVPIIANDILFAGYMPNPIQLYLSIAIEYDNDCIDFINQLKQQYKPGDVIIEEESPIYNNFVKNKIISFIFLHTSVEAFLNYITPHDISYKDKKGRIYGKRDIEERIKFKEKIKLLTKILLKIDILVKYDKMYNWLIELHELRSELVHIKTYMKSNNLEITSTIISTLFESDFKKQVLNVIEFMNLLKPNFIAFEES